MNAQRCLLNFSFRWCLPLLLATSSNQLFADVIITQWNFNGLDANSVPGGLLSPTPSIGSGTASLVGVATTATFASGQASGGSSDPEPTNPPDFAWNTTTYPAQGVGEKTAGAQFNVSTAGSENIVVTWDTRSSNTSARHQQFQYSLDGANFVDFGNLFQNTLGDTWFNQRSIDLSAIAGVNNNPNFAFRFVSAFDPQNPGQYVASSNGTTATYAGGTLRFDMVTVSSVPEPSALGLVACSSLIGGGLLRRRRL